MRAIFLLLVYTLAAPAFCADRSAAPINKISKQVAEPVVNRVTAAADYLLDQSHAPPPPDPDFSALFDLPGYQAVNNLTQKFLDVFITPVTDAALGDFNSAIDEFTSGKPAHYKNQSIISPSLPQRIINSCINPLLTEKAKTETKPARANSSAVPPPSGGELGVITGTQDYAFGGQPAQKTPRSPSGGGLTLPLPDNSFSYHSGTSVPRKLAPRPIQPNGIKSSVPDSYFK